MKIETRSNHEQRVRRLAARYGYRVLKSRARDVQELHAEDHGEYKLMRNDGNYPVVGWHYDASLGEIEHFLRN